MSNYLRAVSTACLFGALLSLPQGASAKSISGIAPGMKGTEAEAILRDQAKVRVETLSPVSWMVFAEPFTLIVCNDQVAMISRTIGNDFPTFARAISRAQTQYGAPTQTIAESEKLTPELGDFSQLRISWVDPDMLTYTIRYSTVGTDSKAVEVLLRPVGQGCVREQD